MAEARIRDIVTQAARHYEPAMGRFLSPGEAARVRMLLPTLGEEAVPVFYGGYQNPERVRFLALPAYMDIGEPLDGHSLARLYPEVAAAAVSAVSILGSGYRSLSHRDVMGSVLGLGIERDSVGDILMLSDREAVIFTTPEIGAFLLAELSHVASDTVKTSPFSVPEDFAAHREFQTVRDTVASPRLDAVVAALANVAREKAQTMIRTGDIRVDYLPCERTDKQISAGSVITIRHVGKFILRGTEEQTKKGRYRLVADKYI